MNNNHPKFLTRMNTKAKRAYDNKINPETNKRNVSTAHTFISTNITHKPKEISKTKVNKNNTWDQNKRNNQ